MELALSHAQLDILLYAEGNPGVSERDILTHVEGIDNKAALHNLLGDLVSHGLMVLKQEMLYQITILGRVIIGKEKPNQLLAERLKKFGWKYPVTHELISLQVEARKSACLHQSQTKTTITSPPAKPVRSTSERNAFLDKEQAEREKAQKEQVAREQAEREKAQKEQAAREQAEREKAQKEQAAREQAEREKAQKEQAAREQAEREKAQKEQAAREQAEREKAQKEQAAREQAEREKAQKEQAAREQAEREKAQKEQAAREQAEREKAQKEQAAREQAEREKAQKEQAAREQAEREKSQKEQAAREQAEREKAQKEQAAREQAEREKSPVSSKVKTKSTPEDLPVMDKTPMIKVDDNLQVNKQESEILVDLAKSNFMIPAKKNPSDALLSLINRGLLIKTAAHFTGNERMLRIQSKDNNITLSSANLALPYAEFSREERIVMDALYSNEKYYISPGKMTSLFTKGFPDLDEDACKKKEAETVSRLQQIGLIEYRNNNMYYLTLPARSILGHSPMRASPLAEIKASPALLELLNKVIPVSEALMQKLGKHVKPDAEKTTKSELPDSKSTKKDISTNKKTVPAKPDPAKEDRTIDASGAEDGGVKASSQKGTSDAIEPVGGSEKVKRKYRTRKSTKASPTEPAVPDTSLLTQAPEKKEVSSDIVATPIDNAEKIDDEQDMSYHDQHNVQQEAFAQETGEMSIQDVNFHHELIALNDQLQQLSATAPADCGKKQALLETLLSSGIASSPEIKRLLLDMQLDYRRWRGW